MYGKLLKFVSKFSFISVIIFKSVICDYLESIE